jgi:hypothetical protein
VQAYCKNLPSDHGQRAGISKLTLDNARPAFYGARVVFERFAGYQPGVDGSVGFTAGPKAAYFERVEWLTLDPFSASAALRRGEIDWWENPPEQTGEGRDLSGAGNHRQARHRAAKL